MRIYRHCLALLVLLLSFGQAQADTLFHGTVGGIAFTAPSNACADILGPAASAMLTGYGAGWNPPEDKFYGCYQGGVVTEYTSTGSASLYPCASKTQCDMTLQITQLATVATPPPPASTSLFGDANSNDMLAALGSVLALALGIIAGLLS